MNKVGMFDDTLLVTAINSGDLDMLRFLLQRGVDMQDASSDGETALCLVIQESNIDAAALLISHGAQVDAPNGDGMTPLMLAGMLEDDEGVVHLLCTAGANLHATDDSHETVLMKAACQPKVKVNQQADHQWMQCQCTRYQWADSFAPLSTL